MSGGNKFFGHEVDRYLVGSTTETYGPDPLKDERLNEMIGGGSLSSYGQKAGEKDGLKISYTDLPPRAPIYLKW